MIGVNEKTTGHIVKPDGSLAILPTTLLGADTAAIIRGYFTWALTNQLEPELYCAGCYNGSRSDKAIYNITDDQIEIICRCQQRVFFGHSLPPAPVAASTTVPNDGGVGEVKLSEDAARLLRLYKKVLIDLGLKEALRCNACYALNNEDGCGGQVLTNSIRIFCRCSNRTYQGLTI